MASVLESIMGSLGGGVMDNLGKQLGADSNQTKMGVAAALPLLLGALSRNAGSGSGAQSLNSALERDHDGSILDDVTGFLNKGDTSDGMGILKHILGGKQQRVENGLSQSTGLSGPATGKLLALMAPMVLGALGKQKRERQMDPSALAGYLGEERKAVEQRAPREMNVMSMLLDSDGDGDVDLSDIAKKGGGLLGKLFG